MTRRAWFNAFSHASDVFRRNPQRAISERLGAAVKLLQIDRDGLRRRLKKAPQFRFDVKLPFRAHFALGGWRGRTEQTLLGTVHSLRIRALGNLPQKFSQKRIELGNLDTISLAADFHISLFVRA